MLNLTLALHDTPMHAELKMIFPNVDTRARFKLWLRRHMPAEFGKPNFPRVRNNRKKNVDPAVSEYFATIGAKGGKKSGEVRSAPVN